jgi:hypothetical protein
MSAEADRKFLLILESDFTFQIIWNKNDVDSFEGLAFCHICLLMCSPVGTFHLLQVTPCECIFVTFYIEN